MVATPSAQRSAVQPNTSPAGEPRRRASFLRPEKKLPNARTTSPPTGQTDPKGRRATRPGPQHDADDPGRCRPPDPYRESRDGPGTPRSGSGPHGPCSRVEGVPFSKSEEHEVEAEDRRRERRVVFERTVDQVSATQELVHLGRALDREADEQHGKPVPGRGRWRQKNAEQEASRGARGLGRRLGASEGPSEAASNISRALGGYSGPREPRSLRLSYRGRLTGPFPSESGRGRWRPKNSSARPKLSTWFSIRVKPCPSFA